MFDYLQQFKRLPKELRQKVSSDLAMEVLTELEKKYNVALAAVVMKVMVKNVLVSQLPSYFISEFKLNSQQAEKLSNELRERLFFVVASYLGLKPELSNFEKQAQEILKEARINFPSEELQLRCKKVLVSYLRGVRSKLDIRSSLQRPINVGGLNLSNQEADDLLKTANRLIVGTNGKQVLDKIVATADSKNLDTYNLKKEIESGRTVSINIQKEPKLISSPSELKLIEQPEHKALAEAKKVAEKVDILTKDSVKEVKIKAEPIKPVAIVEEKKPEKDPNSFAPVKKKSIFVAEKKEVKKEVNLNFKPDISLPISRPAAGSDSKPKMEDIKVAPRTMGPIEELRFLDLDNFRRLGNSPQEITEKIRQKIKLLEKDGYDKRIEAFEAWRKSPVNRLYLTIGQLAVNQGLSLEEASLNRKEKYSDSLSIEEIKGIVDLNSSLMF